MFARKKTTPQTVAGSDKEWSQTGTLVHKPPRGWLHSDSAIIDGGGVLYCVQYVGLMKISKSMRSLRFDERTQVTREAMMRCVEESGIRTLKRRKTPKHIVKMLGDPIVERAGTNVNLRISVDGLKLTAVDSGELIGDHGMPSISFATGGEGEGIDFIGYVAKDQIHDRACHCFDCGDLAYDIITTIGQAFELRYKTYLSTKAVPLEIPGFGEGKGSGMGFDDDGTTLPHSSNVPPPPRRGALPAPPASEKEGRNGTYDTLNDKSRQQQQGHKQNYYDLEGPSAGGTMAGKLGGQDLMRMPGCQEEDPGYSKVKDDGAGGRTGLSVASASVDQGSSYDNPNIFNDPENGAAVTYDNPEGRHSSHSGHGNDHHLHGTASKRPSNNPSFDDSIYDNSANNDRASGGAAAGHNGYPGYRQQQQQQQQQHMQHYPPNAASAHQSRDQLPAVTKMPLPPPPPVHTAGHHSNHGTPFPALPGASAGPLAMQNGSNHHMPMHHAAASHKAAAAPAGARGSANGHSGFTSPPLPSAGMPAGGDINHDLMAHDWFHGILSREEAENILEDDGEFLVRESSTQPGQYVLSGMEHKRVKHLLLVDPEGVVRTRDKVFASVPELIHYHIEYSLPIVSAGSSLTLGTAVVIDMSQE